MVAISMSVMMRLIGIRVLIPIELPFFMKATASHNRSKSPMVNSLSLSAKWPIAFSSTNLMSVRSENAKPSVISTVRGMTMDGREERENAEESILRNNDPDSIEIDERDSQPRKQEEPIISTFRGMTIDGREELQNAEDSILRNHQSDSMKTDERDLQ
jgi:hypothetical protein